jgi:hypothetical protein
MSQESVDRLQHDFADFIAGVLLARGVRDPWLHVEDPHELLMRAAARITDEIIRGAA